MRKMLAASVVLVFLAASVPYAEDPSEVIEVFETGIPAPAGMALTPDGDLLVVNREDTSQVYKIDLEHGENNGLTVFASHRDLCNSRHLAVDLNGYVYIDTSRPSTLEHTRSDGFSSQRISWVGMFQISPDGKSVTRVEGIDDDTLGLAIDPDGDLYACSADVPMDQHDVVAKLAEKSAEHMFKSSAALKPRITKFMLGGTSSLDNRSPVVEKMAVSPTDMAFNSEGDLFFAADGNVLRVHFGFLGPGRPKTFATLPTAKAEATQYLGICADKSDNLYVSATNPYKLGSGVIFKVDSEGEVTTFAKGFLYPADCVTDAEGNVYVSDLKAGQVYQVPAEALQLEGPFRIKKPPPPPAATPPAEPVVAEKPRPEEEKPEAPAPPAKPTVPAEPTAETQEPAPPDIEPDLEIARMKYRELSENLASIEKGLDEKQALTYPDTIVLKGGQRIKCEIVEDSEDAVYANMSTGSASIMRDRIELVVYGTDEQKERALQAKSEVEQLERQRDKIKSRMNELRPSVRRTKHPARFEEYDAVETEEEETEEYQEYQKDVEYE